MKGVQGGVDRSAQHRCPGCGWWIFRWYEMCFKCAMDAEHFRRTMAKIGTIQIPRWEGKKANALASDD